MSALAPKQTCALQLAMSALGQKRHWPPSLDYLVGGSKQCLRACPRPIARTPPLGLSCCRRRCGTVAVLTQFQGKCDEENAKYDRIGRDGPDQPKCAGPWGNQDDGAEYYRQHAAKD